MSIGQEQLRKLATFALNRAREEVERTKSVTPVIALEFADSSIEILPFPAEFASLMNHGKAKDLVFATVREFVQKKGARAVVFATEAWVGRQTEAAKALPHEEILRLSREPGFTTAIALGFIERIEALMVTAQNADEVLLLSQPLQRDGQGNVTRLEATDEKFFPQSGFIGRQKMFGDLREEHLR